MSEGTVGLIILTSIALASALLWHRFVPFYRPAVIGATITAVTAFQVADYVRLGYLDPFFLVAVVTSSVVAAVIALLVGIPFRARRKLHVATSKTL